MFWKRKKKSQPYPILNLDSELESLRNNQFKLNDWDGKWFVSEFEVDVVDFSKVVPGVNELTIRCRTVPDKSHVVRLRNLGNCFDEVIKDFESGDKFFAVVKFDKTWGFSWESELTYNCLIFSKILKVVTLTQGNDFRLFKINWKTTSLDLVAGPTFGPAEINQTQHGLLNNNNVKFKVIDHTTIKIIKDK